MFAATASGHLSPSRSRSPYPKSMTKISSIAVDETTNASQSEAATHPEGGSDSQLSKKKSRISSEGAVTNAPTAEQRGKKGESSQREASEPTASHSYGTAFQQLSEGDQESREEMEDLRKKFLSLATCIDDPLHGPSLSTIRDMLAAIPERFLGIGDMPKLREELSQKKRLGKHQKKTVLAKIETYFKRIDELSKTKGSA